MQTIDQIYSIYDEISNQALDFQKRMGSFSILVNGIYHDSNTKRLSCQFIAKFFKNFPDLQGQAYEKVADLCFDDVQEVRKQAVHDLQIMCKTVPEYAIKGASVLTQMMQTDDHQELSIVNISLSFLLNSYPAATLNGIFTQLLEDDNPDASRENIFKFLHDKLRNLPEVKFTSELEDLVVQNVNKLLQDCGEEEFHQLIAVLSSLRCMSSVVGRQNLITMITEQAINAVPEFVPNDTAVIAQIRESCKQIVLFASKNVHAEKMLIYLLDQVLPVIQQVESPDQLSLLQAISDLITHSGPKWHLTTSDLTEARLNSAHDFLVKILPNLSENNLSSIDVNTESFRKRLSNGDSSVDYKFSELECLLYIIQHLAALRPQFYGGFNNESERESVEVKKGEVRLKIVRPRIQFLARLSQEYANIISEKIKNQVVELSAGSELSEDELNIISHRLMSNIQILGRNFFKNPPSFKQCLITLLSWQSHSKQMTTPISSNTASAPIITTSAGVRIVPITFGKESEINEAPKSEIGKKRNRQMNTSWKINPSQNNAYNTNKWKRNRGSNVKNAGGNNQRNSGNTFGGNLGGGAAQKIWRRRKF